MIFVTVGTHEQQFNRLVETIDNLKIDGKIKDPVFIQTGYSTYKPRACKYKQFISMNEMNEYMKNASVVITHGGPSSFILALQHNKIPLVVPRLAKFHEHVNNHQMDFCRELVHRKFPIDLIENVNELASVINEASSSKAKKDEIKLNNSNFMEQFQSIVKSIMY